MTDYDDLPDVETAIRDALREKIGREPNPGMVDHLTSAVLALFSEQPIVASEQSHIHDREGRLERSICVACGDAYIECSQCGTYACRCIESEAGQ